MTPRPPRISTVSPRVVLSAITIAACLPYLVLKMHWITGGRTGITDPAFGDEPVLLMLNVITGVLDAIVIGLALAFVTRWGRRVPALLITLPMWVGAGLLGTLVISVPIQLVLLAFAPPASGPAAPLAPWVFNLVYAGFGVQGICLLAGFFLYARDRWGEPSGWNLRAAEAAPRRTRLPVVAAALLALVGIWALATFDWAQPSTGVLSAVLGVLALAGAWAIVALARSTSGLRRWVLFSAAWLGTSAEFAWGCYLFFLSVVANPLNSGRPADPAEVVLHGLRIVAGVTGILGTRTLFPLRRR